MAERPVAIGDYEPRVPVEEGLRRVIPERTGANIGGGLESLGEAGQQLAQNMQKQDAASFVGPQLAKLRVAAEQHFLNASQSPQDALDKAGGFTPMVMNGFQQTAQDSLKDAPNALAKRLMQNGIANVSAELQERSMRQDVAIRTQAKVSGAVDAAKMTATAVELNPDSWENAGREQLEAVQHLGLDPETTNKLANHIHETVTEAAGNGYAKLYPQQTLLKLHDANDPLFSGMSQDVRAKIESAANVHLEDQNAQAIVDAYRSSPKDGIQAYKDLDANQTITPEQKEAIRGKAERDRALYTDEQRQKMAPDIEGLEERIARGKPAEGDRRLVDTLYQNGAFNATQAGETKGRLEKAADQQAQDAAFLQSISDAYKNSQPLDPKDKDTRTAIDMMFQSNTEKLKPGTQQWTNTAESIAQRTGVVPDSAITWARTSLVSGDPQTAAQAATSIEQLNAASPRGIGFAMDDKTKAMSSSIVAAINAGSDPVKAVEIARQNASMPEAEAKQLEEQFKKLRPLQTSSGQATNDLQSAFKQVPGVATGFIFKSVPEIPTLMKSQYQSQLESYYRYTGGNMDQASKLAAADIQREWGVSEVNGKREFMQWAPEAQGYDTASVREDIEKSVAGLGVDAKGVRLVPGAVTENSNGRKFNLATTDKFGAPDIILGANGRARDYELPNAQAAFEAHRETLAAGFLAKAREKQARDRANDALMEKIRGEDDSFSHVSGEAQ